MGDFHSHYEENGNQDPRGRGTREGANGTYPDDLSKTCPFCGAEVARSYADHLPCEEDDTDAA